LKFLFTAILFLFVSTSFGQDEEVFLDFEPLGGKYDEPTTVTLTSTEGATIYYTLDGSRPSSGGTRYRKPIEVKTVKVIRAIAYKNGKRSEFSTQSYFCDREYTLPIISIATNPENLWDYNTGIYVKGCCADTIEPYIGANFWKNWEKHSNIEMYETDGELAFNQVVGINLFGGFSRMLPQKSLAIFARKKYGESRINYPIFPERDFKKYKSFIIRNSGGDFRRTHFRDAFMTQLAAPTGVAIQAYRPAIVFLNGEYWGVQNLREKISEHYLKSNFGVDKDNVDILRHNGVVRHGTSANYKKLLRFLRVSDMSNDDVVAELRTFMDIEDYLRYNITETYSDNRDAGGNIRYWRERNDSAKWRWVLYDLDLGMGNNSYTGYKRNTVKKFTSANAEAWPDPSWSTFIIRKLLENKTLEYQYINTFADHLNTVYSSERALALIDEIYENLKAEMPYHVDKWQTSVESWNFHVDVVRDFARERPAYLRKYIMQKFDLKGMLEVQIKYPGSDIAKVSFNSLKIEDDFDGIYFQDVPVTITVEPKHDYIFIGWSGRYEKTMSITISSRSDLVLEPLFEPKARSANEDSIIFNEIAVYQAEGDSSEDWVELYNRSIKPLDLSGWRCTKSSFKKGFVLPENTVIQPGDYLVLARNKANYSAYYNSDTLTVVGDFNFGLSKKGEHIKLYDLEGLIVDSLTYVYDEWDTAATFNLEHPDSASDVIANWNLEKPNPGDISRAYKRHLKHEADKKYWTKIYYFGGGSFFFILVVGTLLRRSSKKRKKSSGNNIA
tara:strand:- start:506 stop:2851 length:2346 start_codon:yes stop_codon:yes gene_type:complete